MKIYQRRSPQPMKWFLAFVLFCLVLGWTMSDVYGFDWSQRPCHGNEHHGEGNEVSTHGDHHTSTDHNPASPVPEPSTLMLLASGLGAGALMLRRKKS